MSQELRRWMYNENLPERAGLTPEFEDGVKTFIKWAKGPRRHMDRDQIRCLCRKCKNTKFGTPDEVDYHMCMRGFMAEYLIGFRIVKDTFEASVLVGGGLAMFPIVGDEQHMNWHRE
ncbi:UNVERIFIED_CONTAM: hypothetical protein Sangu_3218700, partial [Sesamum angustifolium]